jgi:aminopeptidase N
MKGAYGIEYPGIVGINYSLYDIDSSTGGNPTYAILESTVAHETAHQWFYSVVGDDQINEPWLDESMTQYTTGLYYLAAYGNAGFTNYENTWYSRWDRVKQETIPIGLPAGSYLGKEYSAIVYGRGPIFVDKLSDTMGQEKFSQFLKDYYAQNKWGISTTASYKQLAEVECQCDLTQLFTDWIFAK